MINIRTRGFQVVSSFEHMNIELPQRQTYGSAGYDIRIIKGNIIKHGETKVFSTGLKAYMLDNEYLAIHIRSSVGIKRNLMLANVTGIIDHDFFDNPVNGGHIVIALTNYGDGPQTIEDNERVAQGIFCEYLRTDNDQPVRERKSGIGSSGTN